MGRIRAVSHYMDVDAVVSILLEEHGNTKARGKALREQQNARRARSRKRFAFWVAVASEIDARQQLAHLSKPTNFGPIPPVA